MCAHKVQTFLIVHSRASQGIRRRPCQGLPRHSCQMCISIRLHQPRPPKCRSNLLTSYYLRIPPIMDLVASLTALILYLVGQPTTRKSYSCSLLSHCHLLKRQLLGEEFVVPRKSGSNSLKAMAFIHHVCSNSIRPYTTRPLIAL